MTRPPPAEPFSAADFRVQDLGRMGYAEALAVQREAHSATLAGRAARVPMPIRSRSRSMIGYATSWPGPW